MKFNRLDIKNLRAVERFTVENLPSFVVIAGQNGSGKSCVFDAIRLLKSLYGGYSQNEHMQWFGEFAINVQDRRGLSRMFRNPSDPMDVTAELELAPEEVQYILDNLNDLAYPVAWARVTGQPMDDWSFNRISIATQLAQFGPQVEAMVQVIAADARAQLQTSRLELSVSVRPDGTLNLKPCMPAQLAFQAYRPDNLGVIEYHSASRAYTRQDVGGINLDARSFEDQRRQQGLYNWQAKYQNVKTELASGYIRSLISASAGQPAESGEDLNSTMTELFRTFFPDKEYEGVRAMVGGALEFPVKLSSGRTHDIDDLSSGEKEILYGYLRLKNSTPRRSVILLDEPELHLNPSLLQGFADFYYRHLGVAQENQLWLVTHSDTLLRQAVGNSNYRVYHMTPATATDTGANQASEVLLNDDVERATIDLVGDLASYRPHAKVVILEGAEVDGFDVSVVRRLFPDFARRVNLVGGGNKARVRDLYSVLAESTRQAGMENRFFAITDRDREAIDSRPSDPHQTTWDRYHIENYLLDPTAILRALNAISSKTSLKNEAQIVSALKACAKQLVDQLTLERVQAEINDSMVAAIRIGASPETHDVVSDIIPSITSTLRRLNAVGRSFDARALETSVARHRSDLETSLNSEAWLMEFPGRSILKRFVGGNVTGIAYEAFANLILDKLAEAQSQPPGMKSVLDAVLAA